MDLAFDDLERAHTTRRDMTFLGVELQPDSLRSDSRFADLLKRVGPPA